MIIIFPLQCGPNNDILLSSSAEIFFIKQLVYNIMVDNWFMNSPKLHSPRKITHNLIMHTIFHNDE